MLTKEQLQAKIAAGIRLLDGATGSNLQKAGMPAGCCTEEWIINHPDALVALQRRYAEAGSQIIYAPTFQAQPIALEQTGLAKQTEAVNEALVALSRSAAPGCLIAGDITTLAAFMETWDPDNYGDMVANYRRQIRGLIDGGADLLIGETLLYTMEAEAILEAADKENAGAVMLSFTMGQDGALFSGRDAGNVLPLLEGDGAAAVGFNCVAASDALPHLVQKLRRSVKGPLICKPNAGLPFRTPDGRTEYPMTPDEFAAIMAQCAENGATLLGGCCGTGPEYIAKIVQQHR